MKVLENATIRLLRRKPFFGHILLQFRKTPGRLDKPLGVTLVGGVPTLVFNEELCTNLDDDLREALLEHCIRHLLHLHMSRRKGREERTWNIAADLTINPAIPSLVDIAPVPERYRLPAGLSAEEYYDLLKRTFSTGNQQGGGIGAAEAASGETTGEGSRDSVDLPDDHSLWDEADATPLPLAEEVVRAMVRKAHRGADGDVPFDLRTVVDRYLGSSPASWRQVLRQFIATAGRTGRKGSWKKEHRRFGNGVPGISKRRKLNLLIGIDVSESTDHSHLREAFAQEVLRIAEGRESHLTVLYASSRIRKIESFSGKPSVVEAYHGGGFTDLRPVFDYAKGMMPPPAAVIYLTDGKGQAPERMEFQTLWVLTPEGEKPVAWGVELRLADER